PSEDQEGGGQPTRHELIGELHEHLLTLAAVGARVVVFIDEAQNLAPEVIEQVRVLTNLESPSGTLLQVVLVGQLSLLTLLRRPELLAVDQRISLRCQLEPFGLEETMEYINHRLH